VVLATALVLSSVLGQTIFPGDVSDYFSVKTLGGGQFTYKGSGGGSTEASRPIVVYAYDPRDGMSEAMFNPPSVNRFLDSDAPGTYLFLCHCENNSQAAVVAERMSKALANSQEDWSGRLHFGIEAVKSMSNYIPNLFEQWNSTVALLGVNSNSTSSEQSHSVVLKRLDGHFGWLGHAPVGSVFRGMYGNVCDQTEEGSIKALIDADANDNDQEGIALLIPWDPAKSLDCPFVTILEKAEKLGAASAILYPTDPNHDLTEISCQGDECNVAVNISATMVSGPEAMSIAAALEKDNSLVLTFTFIEEPSPGRSFAIDFNGNLQENGWEVWPWLSYLSWSAQYLKFEHQLDTKIDLEDTVVNVFDGSEVMNGDVVAHVPLEEDVIQQLQDKDSTLLLELALGCSGRKDYDCPSWDHVVQLFVCCGSYPQSCLECPNLIWLSPEKYENGESGNNKCGPEVGRWMTPFRRQVGHWLTDASLMKGALLRNLTTEDAPQKCQFTIQSVSWASTGSYFWHPRLNLRIKKGKEEVFTKPTVTSLFDSKTFDKHFNDRVPYFFPTPYNLFSAYISALITGHGSDNNGCAEFCAGISNHFVVNGVEFKLDFQNAGTQLGCTDAVVNGSEPNEHGTWFFGRNGWCDGQDVTPWEMEITKILNPPGKMNIVEYAGLYMGDTPNPSSNPGEILMSSFLILNTLPPPTPTSR
jgi:hypothetical protein